jgi:hypothetical protein
VQQRVRPQTGGLQFRTDTPDQVVSGQPRDVLRVEPVELLGIEDSVAAADALERETRNQLVAREDLLVAAGRPAEQRQEVHHRLGEIALALVLGHRRGAVPLAQAFLVGTEDQRHMRERGRRRAEGLVQQDLLRRVRDVIVAANHVRDRHVHVVADDGELVGRLAVRSQDDEVLDRLVLHGDGPVHQVVERRPAFRHAHADGARLMCRLLLRDLLRRQRQAAAVVDPAFAPRFRLGARGLQTLGRAVAEVRVAAVEQPLGRGAVTVEPRGLEVRRVRTADIGTLVPLEPQPAQAVEDAAHHLGGRSPEVGVLDAEHERPTVTAGEQVVEEGRPRASDVKVTSRRRGESHARRHNRIIP